MLAGANDFGDYLLRQGQAEPAGRVVDPTLRQGQSTPATAAFLVQSLQGRRALFGRQRRQVQTGDFGGMGCVDESTVRVLVDQVTITTSDDRRDIVGRSNIQYATESNVIDLANRPERILGKQVNRKVKTA